MMDALTVSGGIYQALLGLIAPVRRRPAPHRMVVGSTVSWQGLVRMLPKAGIFGAPKRGGRGLCEQSENSAVPKSKSHSSHS
jgi:hypothetical protein